MDYKSSFYPESQFGGFSDIDGTIAFYSRINALVEPFFTVLNIGCGRGASTEDPVAFRRNLMQLKGKVAQVIGIDVDEGARKNPMLDEFRLIEKNVWPLENDSVDLAISDFVLEHVDDPEHYFAELRRVLKHGGYVCLRTPNAWGYVGLISRLIPNRFHVKVLKIAHDKTNAMDVFPTVYRCNSIWKIRAMLRTRGFAHVVYGYEAEPSYFAFSRILYWLGVLHQRFVPGFLKLAIFAFGKIDKTRSDKSTIDV